MARQADEGETMELNRSVRDFWEREPCGTSDPIVGPAAPRSPEWFRRVERHRYQVEPCIHAVAQFSRFHGRKLLEVGVGAGTDHLQWARAGAMCHGVDLTDAAIETTRAHLALHGFESALQRMDAETLPFSDATFDVVYSWGVIHHSERPDRIIAEIHRVLKPGGVFVGMMYGRHSLVAWRLWVRYGLRRMRPWRSLGDVVWHHMESLGTKAYTESELRDLFAAFANCRTIPILTHYDTVGTPRVLHRFVPNDWGWFIGIQAEKG